MKSKSCAFTNKRVLRGQYSPIEQAKGDSEKEPKSLKIYSPKIRGYN